MKKITLDIISLINLFGFCLGLFFSLVIFRYKKGDRLNRRILSAMILSLCAIVLTSFLWTSGGYYHYPHLFKILPLFYLLIGPLLYFYLKSLTVENFHLKPIHLLHSIPFWVNVIFYLPFYLSPARAKISAVESFFSPHEFNIYLFIFLMIRLVHLTVYLTLALQMIHRYSGAAKNIYSSQRQLKLSWMKVILAAFVTVFLNYLLFFLVRLIGGHFFNKICSWLSLWETLIIVYLSYRGLTHPDVIKIGPGNGKGKQVNFSEKEMISILKNIQVHMGKNKPYLNSIFTIRDLSSQMSIPYWTISQIINDRLKQNFFEFINSYRIKEAQRLIINGGEDKSIIQIAYACGFNSKSAFNSAFKKITGETPSQYRRTQKNMS